MAKILSSGLKIILPKIISEEQTCSIPRRTIFNNLFLIRDTIKLTKEKNAKLYILQIDQEKAFVKIGHNFLYKKNGKSGFLKLIHKFHRNLIKK